MTSHPRPVSIPGSIPKGRQRTRWHLDKDQGERQHRDRQGILHHRRVLLSGGGSLVSGRPNFPDLGSQRQTYDDIRVEIEIDLGENA
jgi:hypothetical protein